MEILNSTTSKTSEFAEVETKEKSSDNNGTRTHNHLIQK